MYKNIYFNMKPILITEQEKKEILNLHYLTEQTLEKGVNPMTYFKKYGRDPKAWQSMLLCLGADLGKSGPLKNGVDGQFGKISKKELKRIMGPTMGNKEPKLNAETFFNLLLKSGYKCLTKNVPQGGQKKQVELFPKDDKTKSSQLKQSTTNSDSKKDSFSFGFTNYFRKYFPNITQMFFTRDLSSSDFTKSQKKVLFDVILSAIKRGQSPKIGSTQYEDYSQEIKAQLDTKEGASTLKTVVGSLLPDDKFKMATTLGRFSYKLVDGNKYLVTDNYDFSKGVDYDKINSKELEDKSYTEKLFYVMKKNDWSLYRASRFLAYLEHPQNSPDKEKIKIKVELDPQELAQLEKVSNTNNLS